MLNAAMAMLDAQGTPRANRDALQTALNIGGPVYIPRGLYPLAPGAVAAAPGQVIFGDGPAVTILDCRGNGDFLSDGEWWGMEVRDLQLCGKVGGHQVTGGRGIVFDGSVGSNAAGWQMPRARVSRVLMDGMWRGIYVRDQNNVTIEGVTMGAMQDHGIVCESPSANARTDAVTIRDYTYSPDPAAVAAGRGTGILIDGNVQTVDVFGANIVGALRGIDVQNSAGLPLGSFAAFLTCDSLKVDFPRAEAVRATHLDGFRAVNSYFHGSATSHGISLGTSVRDSSLVGCKITSHALHGVFHNGADLDVVACKIDDNSQSAPGAYCGLVVWSSARVTVAGGGCGASVGTPVRVAYGVYRNLPSASVSISGTRLQGTAGGRNF
jgi:hypothetical protein